MKERWLQYIWNYKIFTHFQFISTSGLPIEVLDYGQWNTNAGPDFLLAKIKIGNLTLVGNIEIHLRSSDWILHRHENEPQYQNLILHVVLEEDIIIEELYQKNIPTLVLKNHVDPLKLKNIEGFLSKNLIIPCEKNISEDKIPFYFHEENVLNKLEEKSLLIEKQLEKEKNNYEAVLFQNLAYAFGLKINASIFLQIAEMIDFSVITKIRQNHTQLEALFFGISGFLESPKDDQMVLWKREFEFLKAKFSIPENTIKPLFLRLRPPNFPTIRWSQLANLYANQPSLFSRILEAKNVKELFAIFKDTRASSYWDTHYNFGVSSPVQLPKKLSNAFVELVILNTILPIKYQYFKNKNTYATDDILSLYSEIRPEKNSIIDHWKSLKIPVENALVSQSINFQYKNFCSKKKCLNCGIGYKIVKE